MSEINGTKQVVGENLGEDIVEDYSTEDCVAYVSIGTCDESRFSGAVGFEEGEFKEYLDVYESVLQDRFEYADIEFDNNSYDDSFGFDDSVDEEEESGLRATIEEAINDCYIKALKKYGDATQNNAGTATGCSMCEALENLDVQTVTLYGGKEITVCNDCLTSDYTGCADCGIYFSDESAFEMKMLMRDENAGDYVCIFCNPTKFIDVCENLKELCDTLNMIDAIGANDGNNIDYCELPTFGEAPENSADKFSWDDEFFLVKLNSLNPWELIERDDI